MCADIAASARSSAERFSGAVMEAANVRRVQSAAMLSLRPLEARTRRIEARVASLEDRALGASVAHRLVFLLER